MANETIYLEPGISGEELMSMKGLQVKVIHGRRHIIRIQETKQPDPEPELEEKPAREPKPRMKRGPKPGIERKNFIVRQSKMNDE